MISPWILLGVFIFISYTTETITGFGSIVIAISLGALVLPIPEMLPVVVPLNILNSTYLSIKHRRHIHWPTLLRLILPAMTIGTVVGHFLKPYVGSALLQSLFGALIVWFSVRELLRLFGHLRTKSTPRARAVTWSWMGAAGVTHGLYASGGPLLVYALTGQPLDKSRMRATLIFVWLFLNSLLTTLYLIQGTLIQALPRTAMYLPIALAGMIVGEALHSRIDELQFRKALFGVLTFTGIALAIPKTVPPSISEPASNSSEIQRTP